jgi:hypothetical protein
MPTNNPNQMPLRVAVRAARTGRDRPAMSVPARVGGRAAHPLSPAVPRTRTNHERASLVWEITSVLGEFAARYPDVPYEVIRQQAIEVLGAAEGNRVTATLVVRLVEARVIALL